MAPVLRSSAPTTPTRSTDSANTTPSTTPRKVPHCKKCGRPKAGHPRQGCPHVDSPLSRNATNKLGDNEPDVITNAFESMNIESPSPQKKNYRRRSSLNRKPLVVPEASLASLSTNSSEIVARLLKPGIMDNLNEECEETKASVAKWQEKLANQENKANIPPRTLMPGTLQTPSDSSFQFTQEPFESEKPLSENASTTTIGPNTVLQSPHLVPGRSMSTEEREAFLIELNKCSKAPPASVYVLPVPDIPTIKHSAEKVGFHTCVVDPAVRSTTKDVTDGWLILGRDIQAVQALNAELESRKSQGNANGKPRERGKGTGTLRAAAGGAVVGAVATWTGLAFS